MKTVLIVGVGQGLGRRVAELCAARGDSVYGTGRAEMPDFPGAYVQCDATRQGVADALPADAIFDLVLYCPSLYSQSGVVDADELDQFLQVGPLGLVRTVQSLHAADMLSSGASFFSVGSTATVEATAHTAPPVHANYTVTKEAQRQAVFVLQRQLSSSLRLTTLTLGGLEGEGRIPAVDVLHMMDSIHGLSPASRPMEIVMPALADFS